MAVIYGDLKPFKKPIYSLKNPGTYSLVLPWEGDLPGMAEMFDVDSDIDAMGMAQDWVNLLADTETPALAPVQLSNMYMKWPAMSLLQKAGRRSREDWAHLAVSGLIHSGETQLVLRRMAVISLEDLGLAGLPVLIVVLGILRGTIKVPEGQAQTVILSLVKMMMYAAKDRSACDVASLILCRQPKQKELIDEIDDLEGDELVMILTDLDQPLMARVQANRKLAAKPKLSDQLRGAYKYMNVPPILRAIIPMYKAEFKDPMWMGLASLWSEVVQTPVVSDTLPVTPTAQIGGIPSCCWDMFTSDGKKAAAYFRKMHDPIKRALVELDDWTDALGYAIFAAEGGNLDRSLNYPARADLAVVTLHEEFASVGLDWDQAVDLCYEVHTNLDKLEYARQKVISSEVFKEV